MTVPESSERVASAGATLRDIALAAAAGLALLFGAGVIAGMVAAAIEKGGSHTPLFAVFLIGAITLVVGSVAILLRTVPRLASPGVLSPRTQRARSMLYLSMLVGAVIGVVVVLGGLGKDPWSAWSGPIAPAAALVAIVVWLIAVPLLSLRWWRNIDEHEALAYKDGALAAMYAYSAIAPTWWVGWRGGWLPEPQEMITFLAVVTVWGIVWVVRRYA